MRLYGALLLAFLAGYFWPDRNVLEVPFSELTLKLIFGTLLAFWLAYHALKLAFASFALDKVWPWRWTREIVFMLALRVGWMAAFFAGLWAFREFTKFGPWIDNHPITVGIVSFIFVTFAVCADDESIRGDTPHPLAAADKTE
jgi:hypothetical protein